MMSQNTVLNNLGIESVDEGMKIYVYRVYQGKFVSETGIASERGFKRGIVGRLDKDGKLCGTYIIGKEEGVAYSKGGLATVWYTKSNKRKAKKVLRDIYKKRIVELQKRLNGYNDILEVLK